jgi:hypothetical protein
MPSYAQLMTETDDFGREWSYLSSERSYGVIRDLQLRNLIVPLTGDFGGTKAIRAVGRYVKDHGAVVSVFYTSNVEGYLFRGGDRAGNPNGGASKFYENVSTLPLDESSTFIRWIPGAPSRRSSVQAIYLAPIVRTIEDFESGRFSASDLLPANGGGFGRGGAGRFFNPDRRAPSDRSSAYEGYFRIGSYFIGIAAFLVRLFIWRPSGRERIASIQTILISSLWAIGGYVFASGLAALIRFLI